MEFKKLSKVQEVLLKMNNREAYINYKFLKKLQAVQHPSLPAEVPADVHFKHSGNAGDLIYALPVMHALAKGGNIHLHLHINQPVIYPNMQHPLGNVMLNEKMLAGLQPLILAQPGIATCDAYSGGPLHYDLDVFRTYPYNYKMGHIARWYFLVFATNYDLGKAWLQVKGDESYKDTIVIARSQRYRQPGISYRFLERYPKKVFVGIEQEYREMKEVIPGLEYRPVKDFYELASVIQGSRLFIGNQSFPFSIAEGLKTRRLLEMYFQSPNVIVEGPEGYDFCYQPQFEKLVKDLYEKSEQS
jgi:hypothetical protein